MRYLTKRSFISFTCFLVILLLCFFTGCNNKNESFSSPPEYNLNRPSIIKLPDFLSEISGVAYYAKDNSIFAISDEKALLYKVFLSKGMEIQKWKFADKADYEDIVLIDSTFYILQSKGDMTTVRFFSADSITTKEYKFPGEGKNEFEILYRDSAQKRLIMICKDCDADNKSSLTAWAFDISSLTFSPTPAFVIDVRKIAEMMQEKKVKFKPSAAALHPLTGKLYIISSINKVLVVADKKGVPEKVYQLDPKLYKQPEGLTFSPEGHLIISNESADIGAADIMFFKYNKSQ